VHQAAVGIDADVRLHPEEPLVALLGLMHLGVALAFGVLGGAGRRDDGRVHDAAALEQQALARQQRVDHLQDVVRQVVGLEQVPEVQDGRLVRDRLVQAQWHIAARPSDIAKLPEGRAKTKARKTEHHKASVRAKVEHPFRVIKRQFDLVKVRFRGLAKNTAHVTTLFALSNLWMVRKQLMAMTAAVRPKTA